MADCRIVNEKVSEAAESIRDTMSQKYADAGTTFETAFNNAIADMEGDTKDALVELYKSQYQAFLTSEETGIPSMIKSLGTLLEENRKQFEDVDAQIASSIRDGGQG